MGPQVDGTPDSSESLIKEEYVFSYRHEVRLIISHMRWKSYKIIQNKMLKFTKDFASKAKYHMRAHVPLSHWLTTSKIQKKSNSIGDAFPEIPLERNTLMDNSRGGECRCQ